MKTTILSIIIALAMIAGVVILSKNGGTADTATDAVPAQNVSVVNGVQIVEIRAKGGYEPRKSVAKPGLPTVIRFNTNGTFDCSSSVSIPSLHVSKLLPQSGTTDIDIGTQQVGTLYGTCGMGMYPFEIDFQG